MVDNGRGKDNGARGSKTTLYIIGTAVIVIMAGILLLSTGGLSTHTARTTTVTTGSSSSATPSSASESMSVELTDPPLVPSGTQSLIISYSGVSLHEAGAANSTGFVNFSSNGTVNLMNLTNVTQTVAVIKASANESFNLIRFDIKSANITIDNVTYNVTVPTGGVTARINSTVNSSSTGGILIDMSPTVLQVYTSTNESVFVMVPSAVAIAIGKQLVSGAGLKVGAQAPLQSGMARAIQEHANANITITSATASEAGNVTQLSITVRNNGNSSVLLSDMEIKGFFEAIPSSGSEYAGAYMGINAMPYLSGNFSNTFGFGKGSSTPLNASLNSTVIADMHGVSAGGYATGMQSGQASLGIGEAEIFDSDFHNQLDFIVEANGTLALPSNIMMAACPAMIVGGGSGASEAGYGCHGASAGYSLPAGASATLAFNGIITMPDVGITAYAGVSSGRMGSSAWNRLGPTARSATAVLIPNQTYSITIQGSSGATAYTKVNATGYATSYASTLVDVTAVELTLKNQTSRETYNTTMPGFISRTNSTVSYSVSGHFGANGINATGFLVDTAGFTLLNYSAVALQSQCNTCQPGPGKACPMYACIGRGSEYLLDIKMPASNYTGTISITEDYTPIVLNDSAIADSTT